MIKNWKETLVFETERIVKAVEILQTTALQIILVVDKNSKLVGVVSDGDIRRAILNGQDFSGSVREIMNPTPVVVTREDSREKVLELFREKVITRIPVVDRDGRVIDLYRFELFINSTSKPNPIIIMAGGLGSRLGELTEEVPKPLLKVGGKPILETILQSCIEQGFHNFYLSVNYKSEMIKNFFQNGEKWGVRINYLEEDKRLGTAGALKLLDYENNDIPFIVINGDILTKVDFTSLIKDHNENNSCATMCVKEFDFQVPYGVIEIVQNMIHKICEKPLHKFLVNAGIYMLSPKILKYILSNEYLDMTQLFNTAIENGEVITVFPIHEYWLDIGKIQDFERAQTEYHQIF